jgi:hypothetical protein
MCHPVSSCTRSSTSRSWGTRSVGAGVPPVLRSQLGGDDPPDVVLLGGVLDVGDRLARLVGGTDGGDGRPPGPVGLVGEAGVVGREVVQGGR